MADSDEKNKSLHERDRSLIRFLGFGGLACLFGFAVVIGKYQEDIDADTRNVDHILARLEKGQEKLSQAIEGVHVQQQQLADLSERVSDIDHRVEKLEIADNASRN